MLGVLADTPDGLNFKFLVFCFNDLVLSLARFVIDFAFRLAFHTSNVRLLYFLFL